MKVEGYELKAMVSKSHTGIKSCKWDSLYETIYELMEDMLRIDLSLPAYKIPRGYEYIRSFQKIIKCGGQLSEKQIIQLKRLASEIAYARYVLGNGN